MQKEFSLNFRTFFANAPIALQWVILLVIGFVILVIRNPDPLFNPVIYTEDGQWTGLALTDGWLRAFIHAKDSYLVWGNIVLLFFAERLSTLFCGNPIICLPYSIAIFSYLFFSFVAVLAWHNMRNLVPFTVSIVVFFILLLIPIGNSSNEVIGRISNIGYLLVFVATMLIFTRPEASSKNKLLIDVILILCAATNPVCIIIVLLAPILSAIKKNNTFNPLSAGGDDFRLLALGLSFVLVLSVWKYIFDNDASSVIGILQLDNIVEVALARSIIYPFIFPWYGQLTDEISIFLSILLVSYIILMFCLTVDKNVKILFIICLVSLSVFSLMTIGMRQSLTQQLGNYQTTFPDRYFIGLNYLVLFIFCVLAGNLSRYPGVRRNVGVAGLLITGIVFLSQIPWLVEWREPRMPIAADKLFWEEICLTGLAGIEEDPVIVPIMFFGWEMKIPADIADDARRRLDCRASREAFFLSDKNWDGGVARNWSGFFLPNRQEYRNRFVPGANVRFANGDVRQILRQEQASGHLNVFIEGPPLRPSDIGFPELIRVME
jgi:hypothetical protein